MIEKCPICEKNYMLGKTFQFSTYAIYTCKSCLTRFAQPFVDNKEVYNNNFIEMKKSYLDTVAMNKKAYYELSPYFNVKNKRILDIGCGTGSFLNKIKKHNEVLGMEVSESYGASLSASGIPHMIGNIEDGLKKIPDDHFNLITLWDVLEHLDDPHKIIGIVRNKLAASGHMIIWTNNYDDCISSFAEAIYRVSFGKMNTLLMMSFNRGGGHNYNFVSKSLENLYCRNNLKIIKSIITDTASEKLTKSIPFKAVLELFYCANKFLGKGKIICHVLKRNQF
ncbi:MAG: class I SAM-dependent methyltransferase [Desulfobacteraceae bacterium]|nr:class I SAM-dependent methyltransferase [Desulfobacteraceae bacterium]